LPIGKAQCRIDRQIREALDQTAWPANLERIDLFNRRQPEVLLEGKTAEITPTADFTILFAATCLQTDPRADGGAIAWPPKSR